MTTNHRWYSTQIAQCNNDEVLVGVRIMPNLVSSASDVMQMAALCRQKDGNVREVTSSQTQPSSTAYYNWQNPNVNTSSQFCTTGYGSGVAFNSVNNALGVQLQCATSAAPTRANAGQRTLAAAPGGGVVYTGDNNAVAYRQRRVDAEGGRLSSRANAGCVVQ